MPYSEIIPLQPQTLIKSLGLWMMVVFGSKITRFLASFSHSNIFIFLKKKTVTNHERHLANSQMHRIIFFMLLILILHHLYRARCLFSTESIFQCSVIFDMPFFIAKKWKRKEVSFLWWTKTVICLHQWQRTFVWIWPPNMIYHAIAYYVTHITQLLRWLNVYLTREVKSKSE